MKELIEYIENNISLSDEIINDLKAISIEKNVEKGEIILQNKSSRKVQIFVASGCLRAFYKAENGKDHTLQFATKNWWISDYMTLFNMETSLLSIESLSHSKIIIIEQSQLEKLFSKFPQFGLTNRLNLQNRIAALQKRIFGLLTMTAKEKYEKFIADYEIFEKVIPNYQIASFLGITPESLSRVRKEIANS
jgi:CRP-like cAMP-binding protein